MNLDSTTLTKIVKNDDIDEAQYVYANFRSDFDLEYIFPRACFHGSLRVARWIYSLRQVDIHAGNDGAFRWACENGCLDAAQWIYSLGGVDVHAVNYYAFRCACVNRHYDVAQWIHSLGNIDGQVLDECLTTVQKNDLPMLQFLLESGANIGTSVYASIYANARSYLAPLTPATLLEKLYTWNDKVAVHSILLQYCKEEDLCHLDEDITQNLLRPMKSARNV